MNRRTQVGILSCVFLMSCFKVALAQPAEEYIVEFRDGTVIQMEVPDHEVQWYRVSEDGKISSSPIKFSSVKRLDLVTTPATDRVRQIRGWIDQLADPNYAIREAAHAALVDGGAEFKSLLTSAQVSSDPEASWRLKNVLAQLDSQKTITRQQQYDIVQPVGDAVESAISGDAGDWQVDAKYRGVSVKLHRGNVRSIYLGKLDAPSFQSNLKPSERISLQEKSRFPEDRVRVDFETLESGELTEEGLEVGKAYEYAGLKMATSLENGIISIYEFKVTLAETKKMSAGGRIEGTTDADYQGVTTFEFCLPGKPDVAATVHYFGCYLSIVKPDGTILKFFDTRGRQVSELAVARQTSDFVGIYSPTPIARVEVHPTEADENYAFDDVVFDPPKAQQDSGDPELYSLVLNNGERLQSTAIQFSEQSVTLEDLTIGVPSLELPKSLVAIVVPPQPKENSIPESGLWVRTKLGSQLRVQGGDGGLKTIDFEEANVPQANLQACWNDAIANLNDALAFEPSSYPSMIDDETAVPLAELSLDSEKVNTSTENLPAASLNYVSLQPILFSEWSSIQAGAGIIRTNDGQILVIDGADTKLLAWGGDGVEIEMFGKVASLPWTQVRSVRFAATE